MPVVLRPSAGVVVWNLRGALRIAQGRFSLPSVTGVASCFTIAPGKGNSSAPMVNMAFIGKDT